MHTPGPWEWRDHGGGYELFAAHSGRPVVLGAAIVNHQGDWDSPFGTVIGVKEEAAGMRPVRPDDADALLIRAAPDLLAVCERALQYVESAYLEDGERIEVAEQLRAVIARAKGGA